MSVLKSILSISVVLFVSYVLKDHEDRLRQLEKAGEVTAYLEPIPKSMLEKEKRGEAKEKLEKLPSPVTEYNGPELYNSNVKIIFYDKKEFQCLSENIYRESRGEPLIGKISVAMTVLNRAESGKWGYSFCSVIYAPHQYSWTSMKKLKPPHGPSWESSKNAARLFVNGIRVRTLSSKTDHYHANNVSPYWKHSMRQTAVIGHHIFYAQK